MNERNHIAFKEWAIVCAALGSGEQSLILRKGGIHEGREGFRVAHDEFWLFPTGFHQEPDSVIPAARPLLERVIAEQPPTDEIEVRDYVQVEEVVHILDPDILPRLACWHIWSEKTVMSRFQYKTPGLFAMFVRVHRLKDPIRIPNSAHFAGCRSWVDLPSPLATDLVVPVLTDKVHVERKQQIGEAWRFPTG